MMARAGGLAAGLGIVLLAAVLALLAGCAGSGTSRDCTFARIITVAPGDVLTPATAAAILAHDDKVVAVCGAG